MGICRVLNVLGTAGGYGGAMVVGLSGRVEHEKTVPIMLLLLTIALFCAGALVVKHHQRPLRLVFELGYESRRRDEIREATERAKVVTPIRRVPLGVESFNRDLVGR